MTGLTHLDETGAANMVDVSAKSDTVREAVAQGRIVMSADALSAIRDGTAAKGDVLAVARVAGILAAKKTSELIPLCHPLALTKVSVDFEFEADGIRATGLARLVGPTGVEMEALTAVSVALLTLYDMAKSLDKSMIIKDISLLSKTGGKSGDWTRQP
jgi:cyclic pyranopterin monophosphate synthase